MAWLTFNFALTNSLKSATLAVPLEVDVSPRVYMAESLTTYKVLFKLLGEVTCPIQL